MERQALREAKDDLRLFWAVHRATAQGDGAGDAAEDYIAKLKEFIAGPPPPASRSDEERALQVVGAKPIQ